MKRITLLCAATLLAAASYAQLDLDFEEGTGVIGEQTSGPTTGVTEYTYLNDQDGADLHTTTVEDIPGGTTGNTSSRALKFELGANSQNFHFPIVNFVSGSISDTGGDFIEMKILPASTGARTFQLGLKAGGGATVNFTAAYNAASTTAWQTIGIDITGFATGITRIELGFENGDRGGDSGEITWFDDIKQVATLSDGTILAKRLDVYPNPTTGEISISKSNNYKSLKVYNLLGKALKSFGAEHNINISDLSSGMYVIKTDAGQSIKVMKR